MKKLIVVLFFIASLILISEQSQAQDRGFGIGAQVTNPAGISFKGWLSETGALASVMTFSVSENNSTFYLHLDYLNHKTYDELEWDFGYMSYYYGGGARFFWREAGIDNNFFAIRLPAGLNLNFTEVPIDLYLEITPTFDVSPNFNFGFTGGIGFRYFLN